ncbi:MAG: hypothetical protein V3T30_00405 [Thermodesulfobacteriota bacterium]
MTSDSKNNTAKEPWGMERRASDRRGDGDRRVKVIFLPLGWESRSKDRRVSSDRRDI